MFSNSIDTLGKKCIKNSQNLYNYKGVDVPLLGMVDDIIGAAECGSKSIDLNIYITTQIELKQDRNCRNRRPEYIRNYVLITT